MSKKSSCLQMPGEYMLSEIWASCKFCPNHPPIMGSNVLLPVVLNTQVN